MKNFIIGLLLSFVATFTYAANKTCILIGDSIMSDVSASSIGGPNGRAVELASHLITARTNVIIRNISSPGNALGANDYSGFGNVTPTINMIGGVFSYYQCIIVQAATNDFGRSIPWEDSVASLRRIITLAKNGGKKVLMVDPIWRRNENVKNSLGHTLGTYRFMLAVACQEQPTTCYWVGRNANFDSANGKKYYDMNEQAAGTELHLNAAGQSAWADMVIRVAKDKKIF